MNPEELVKLTGWDFLDREKVKALQGKDAAKARELDQLCWRTFNSVEGKRFLRWMVQQTILRPTFTANSSQFGAGIREGQNDLVRQLLAMCERSKNGVEKP